MKSDPLLKMIVNAALIVGDKSEGRIPAYITVAVGGCLVAGEIISATEFMRGDEISDFLSEGINSSSSPMKDSLDDGFLHLKNARFLSGGKTVRESPGDRPFFWRSRLESIDGFALGALNA
jgi:hypothetical protein